MNHYEKSIKGHYLGNMGQNSTQDRKKKENKDEWFNVKSQQRCLYIYKSNFLYIVDTESRHLLTVLVNCES